MVVRGKPQEFAVEMDRGAALSIAGIGSLETPDGWTPEHLLLAALSRCSAASLGFHATRAGLHVSVAVAARGTVTRREADGRHAFTHIDLEMTVEVDPAPSTTDLRALLENAERDCFIGASLASAPRYAWTINRAIESGDN
jgi:organic hydroperoxide reductase OsmC/OhrA